VEFINEQLHRRQLGYGRGRRMEIEKDRIEITSGVRHGKTSGSPISFLLPNRDWEHWQIAMAAETVSEGAEIRPVTRPRPGHGDLAGALKYQTHDARNILERASARETAARVAVGALCRILLRHFNILIGSHVLAIGNVRVPAEGEKLNLEEILAIDPEAPLRCAHADIQKEMMESIGACSKEGDTLGGIAEIVAGRVPPGLGSHCQWDARLDGRLAQALMSIPAVKAVEIGNGVSAAQRPGSIVHDAIFYEGGTRRFCRGSNNAGGMEAGMTNGEEVRARIYVKPIPTLRKPLMSVELVSKEATVAAFERSDTCVVPAAGVVGEAVLGFVLVQAFLEKFGGDSMRELEANYAGYLRSLREY
jgi:chorismate synthase